MPGIYIWGERLSQINIFIHLLTSVFLLGALTHHFWLVIKGEVISHAKAVRRFSFWAATSFLVCFVWGSFVYPYFRYYVRFLVQDKQAPWATGLFEIKEHWIALGLAILPFYYLSSRTVKELNQRDLRLHQASVVGMNVVVWYSFVVGAVLVYLKGTW
jgi:hypothetical protein